MANEIRRRYNFQSGTIDDNPLSNSATTLTSTELAGLAAVDSTEHVALVLDPTGVGNGPEIVHVTAHTGSATTATIVRGREGTSGVQHASTITWVHVATASDFTLVGDDNDQPSTGGLPYEGQLYVDTTNNQLQVYSGSAWLPVGPYGTWTTFTPQLTQSANVTSSIAVGRYLVIGKMCMLHIRNVASASGSAGSAIQITNVPAAIAPLKTGAPNSTTDCSAVGSGYVLDSGTSFYAGVGYFHSSTAIRWYDASAAAGTEIGFNPSFALASGDAVGIDIWYEIA
jgi:hypothetical protein